MVTWPASPQIPTAPGRRRQPSRPPQRGVFEPHTLGSSASGRLADSVQSPRRECSPDDGPRFPANTATASPVQDGHPGRGLGKAQRFGRSSMAWACRGSSMQIVVP